MISVFKVLPRFERMPEWKRYAVPLVVLAAFILLFFILFPIIGGIAVVLSFAPVAACSWLMGMNAGILTGVLAVAVNFILLTVVGVDAVAVLERGVLSSLTLILLGGLAGWVSQLVERLRLTARLLEKEGDALRHEMQIRSQREEELKVALAQKNILLREIHHRVKNNLQVISSLLSLQADQVKDSAIQVALAESQNRVRTMALIHEQLYRSDDLNQISFRLYLGNLVGQLRTSYDLARRGIEIVITADDVFLDADTAIPCGMIVTELVSNAIKHAFPPYHSGRVAIEMFRDGTAGFRLAVTDDGVGFDESFSPESADTLGLQLVRSLTYQLDGVLSFESKSGARVEVSFKPPEQPLEYSGEIELPYTAGSAQR